MGGSYLASKLSCLFQRSLDSGSIPQSWRKVTITPIYKSGDKHDPQNYRPVAVSSCILRIMERIIAKDLLQYLLDNNLLSSTQHGFVKGRSTETAGLFFYDFLTKSLDAHLCVDTIFLDYSRAFDSVPHHLLIQKLNNCGIGGKLMTWIKDYLSFRSQSVRFHGVYSSFKEITSGVIQGSVLGPLFFALFVNDVDAHVNDHLIVKYADDIKLAAAFEEDAMV